MRKMNRPFTLDITPFVLVVFFASGIFWAAPAVAQVPETVNKNAKITRSTKVKDAAGKPFYLKKGNKVKVIYRRGKWYWVKNKAGREAWVKKKFVRILGAQKKRSPQKAGVASTVPQKIDDHTAQPQAQQPVPKDAAVVVAPLKNKSSPVQNQASEETRAAEAQQKIRVAVLELNGAGDMSPKLLGFLTNVITETLDGTGAFQALSTTDIARVLEYQADNQLLGCDDPSCVSKLGNSLGARWLISGDVSKLGKTYVVQIKLHDPRDGQVKKRITREHSGAPEALFKDLRVATKMLVRDLLRQRSGIFQLSASEEGATVYIDDVTVGVTPLDELQVAGGMHSLRLHKDGFVDFRQDFEISKGQPFALKARMQPSEDYRRQYRRTARIVRSTAVISLASSLVAGLAGGFFYYDGLQRAAALQQDVLVYNAQAVRTDSQRDALQQQRQDLAVVDIVAISAGGLSVATGLLGAALYLFGDDPDRYE